MAGLRAAALLLGAGAHPCGGGTQQYLAPPASVPLFPGTPRWVMSPGWREERVSQAAAPRESSCCAAAEEDSRFTYRSVGPSLERKYSKTKMHSQFWL